MRRTKKTEKTGRKLKAIRNAIGVISYSYDFHLKEKGKNNNKSSANQGVGVYTLYLGPKNVPHLGPAFYACPSISALLGLLYFNLLGNFECM